MKRLWRCNEDQFSCFDGINGSSPFGWLFFLEKFLCAPFFLRLLPEEAAKTNTNADIDNGDGGLDKCVIRKQKPSLVASKVN